MFRNTQNAAQKPAPKQEIGKKEMKSARGGLNPQPLPPASGGLAAVRRITFYNIGA